MGHLLAKLLDLEEDDISTTSSGSGSGSGTTSPGSGTTSPGSGPGPGNSYKIVTDTEFGKNIMEGNNITKIPMKLKDPIKMCELNKCYEGGTESIDNDYNMTYRDGDKTMVATNKEQFKDICAYKSSKKDNV